MNHARIRAIHRLLNTPDCLKPELPGFDSVEVFPADYTFVTYLTQDRDRLARELAEARAENLVLLKRLLALQDQRDEPR